MILSLDVVRQSVNSVMAVALTNSCDAEGVTLLSCVVGMEIIGGTLVHPTCGRPLRSLFVPPFMSCMLHLVEPENRRLDSGTPE